MHLSAEVLEIELGTQQVEILIKDDSDEYSSVFSGEINFKPGKVLILAYDEKTNTFC